jgi:elongator complex protein 1
VTTVLLMFCIFFSFQGEACNLLPHLFQITPDHRREGQELQKEISDFEAEFRVTVEDIWARPVTDGDAVVPAPDTWQARMEEAEEKKINPIDKVPKPDLSQGKGWKMNLFDME